LARNGITNFGIDFLREALCENPNSALMELDISQNQIGQQGCENLSLYLGHRACDLMKLNISECGIQGRGAMHIINGLKLCQTLHEIKAYKSNFGAILVRRSINQGLSMFLKFIYLDSCNLGSVGASGVVDAVVRNKNIRKISLRNNDIDDDAARNFGDVLQRLSIELVFLDLSNNCITDIGGEAIALGVATNQSL
jgi:Ran GTPase-activating protein (RanGAP) involved in mRNA processing and transport